MARKKTKLSREEAIDKLWEMGELTWLLTDVQKDMKKNIMNFLIKKFKKEILNPQNYFQFGTCLE